MMDMNADYQQKLEQATNDNLALRDNSGVIFWVDTYDADGAYIHADEGDTHRVTHNRIRSDFEFIEV